MKLSILIQSALAASLGAIFSAAADPVAPEAPPAVVVHGATELRVAPAWESGRNYKYGDFANYDGFAFKAKTGSAHKTPDVNSDVGWEKLNDCGDKSKGAVQCEVGNQAEVADKQADAQKEYQKVKADMTKGRPVSQLE